jgi:purine-binding chemotaxis protein CheW
MSEKTDSSATEQKRTFDWEGARQRIAAVQAALAGLDETSPDVLEQIWAQRAARLAQVPIREDEGEQIELVLAQLGREVYALEAQYVFAIRPANQITRVPRVPDWVAGVVNIRGRVLSAIDLRVFFGLPSGSANHNDDRDSAERTPSLIVAETDSMQVALLTDDVLTVEALPADRIQDASDTIRSIPSEYVRGVVEYGSKDTLVLVLNLPALLADERLIIYEEIN